MNPAKNELVPEAAGMAPAPVGGQVVRTSASFGDESPVVPDAGLVAPRVAPTPWRNGFLVPYEDTEIHNWFERDRALVELRHAPTQETIMQWVDDEVTQALDDGFITGGRGPRPTDEAFRRSAYEYAESVGRLDVVLYYKGCGVHVVEACSLLLLGAPEPVTPRDLAEFQAFLGETLKQELSGAEVTVRLADKDARSTFCVAVDANGRQAYGLAEKVYSICRRCREDVDSWLGLPAGDDEMDPWGRDPSIFTEDERGRLADLWSRVPNLSMEEDLDRKSLEGRVRASHMGGA